MSKSNPTNYLFLLLLAGLFSLAACAQGVGGGVSSPGTRGYDPSDGPFRLAQTKDEISTYRKFIHNNPNSRHLPPAINRLGELLVEHGEKEPLETFVKTFPEYKHKVTDALDEIHLIEKVNQHMNEDPALEKNSRQLKIRRGEWFYARHYFKAFVKLEDVQGLEAMYELRIDKHKHPDFIKIELMSGVSFSMEESFHALTNIRYKIIVAQSAPLGKYKVELAFGTYRREDGRWKRRDGSGIVHEIEVLNDDVTDVEELRVDFRAVSYFAEKMADARQRLKHLRTPTTGEFSRHYMYAYDLAEYTVQAEKYWTFQMLARYHLYIASQNSDPALSQQANQYLQQLGPAPPGLEFVPYTLD